MSELRVTPVPHFGTEDVLVIPSGPHKGEVITGADDGSILRVARDGSVTAIAQTGGRPMGIELHERHGLVVCDASRGLLAVNPDTGTVTVLAGSVAGIPMRLCNNATVAADGTIWFTDSSARFGLPEWKQDLVRHTRTGRLLRIGPDGGEPEVIRDGLAFANGVALAADESYVTVAETGLRRMWRHRLTGPEAGSWDVFVDDLPGYPDNASLSGDGLLWVAIASPTDPVVGLLQKTPPRIAALALQLPPRLQPAPKRTVRALAFDAGGTVVRDLDLPGDGFHMVTGVREFDGVLHLGSLQEAAIAAVDL